jgi:hypothetical protein
MSEDTWKLRPDRSAQKKGVGVLIDTEYLISADSELRSNPYYIVVDGTRYYGSSPEDAIKTAKEKYKGQGALTKAGVSANASKQVSSSLPSGMNRARGVMSSAGKTLKSGALAAGKGIKTGALAAGKTLKNGASSLWQGAKGAFSSAGQTLKRGVDAAKDKMKRAPPPVKGEASGADASAPTKGEAPGTSAPTPIPTNRENIPLLAESQGEVNMRPLNPNQQGGRRRRTRRRTHRSLPSSARG